eukprot:2656757-Pyramimonas_sp.AAC.1
MDSAAHITTPAHIYPATGESGVECDQMPKWPCSSACREWWRTTSRSTSPKTTSSCPMALVGVYRHDASAIWSV